MEVSSTITFATTVPAEAAVKAALMLDLGVSSFTSFSVTAARRHLLAGATVGPRTNCSGGWHLTQETGVGKRGVEGHFEQ